ncbi:MAG: hypothetical protein QXX30_03410 [Candidatus Aenigmatarchaeota archaeon]
MPQISYGLFQPDTELIDPMGSIVINVNTNSSPNFQWVVQKKYKAYGDINPFDEIIGQIPGYHDTVSYKVNFLEHIHENNTPIGISACLTNPDSPSCEGKGPYIILGKRYYIDFRVFYIMNKTVFSSGDPLDYSIFSPVLSLDYSRCSEHYGFFIAAPKPIPNPDNTVPHLVAKHAPNLQNHSMFSQTPSSTNHLGTLNTNIKYRLTVLNDGNDINSFWDDVYLTPGNIVLAVQKAITQGQISIISAMSDNTPIVLYPQSQTYPNSVNPKSYYPFILFRYISASAPTQRVDFSISFNVNVQ